MTLIETLVVVAIIVILIGLLLPAIQTIRQTSQRAQCANQLRQIGLACHAYHDAFGTLPPGYCAEPSADPLATSPGWGWASHLLPYLDQSELSQQLDLTQAIEVAANGARLNVVSIFLCPADSPLPLSFSITDVNGREVADAAPISYAGCYGSAELDEIPGPKEGVFYRNSQIRLSDITDGTSTTIMIGDRAWSHAMAPWAGAVNGGIVRGGPRNAWRFSADAAYPAPNFCCVQANAINSTNDPDGSLDEFFSQHSGGVNIVFADGGARFVHQDIHPAVLLALGTRAGGEVVSEADY
jgi:prepilin-type processing-associated H-X9-DG protein